MNCIQEGIIPTKYYEKLHQASGTRLNIEYKIPNAHICNDGICFKTTIILVKDITSRIILRNLFLALFDSFIKTEKRISTEIMRKKILFRFISKQIMFLKQKHKLTQVIVLRERQYNNEDNEYYEDNESR
jgi:hypothetical protein